MVDDDLGRVPADEALVPDPPDQLDALVAVEEVAGPAAGALEGVPADGEGALPDPGHRARAAAGPARPAGAPSGRATAGRPGRPGAAAPRRPGGRPGGRRPAATPRRRWAGRRRRRRRRCTSPRTAAAPTLRPSGMPTFSGRWTVRTSGGRPVGSQPLPTTHDVEVDAGLGEQRLHRPGQLLGTGAHAQHDGADAAADRSRAHRSRREVRIATRCPTTVSPATGTSTATSPRVTGDVATGEGVADRCEEGEQRHLDRVEHPVERHEPRQRAQPADRRDLRRRLLRPVGQPRQAAGRAGQVHGVVERLVDQHQDGQDGTERRPAAERVEPAVGAHPEGERDGRTRRRCARACRGRSRPARRSAATGRPRRRSSPTASAAGRAAGPARHRPGRAPAGRRRPRPR